ncbi:hypothetical protein ACLOJK_002647, partial [Asimina triloba]
MTSIEMTRVVGVIVVKGRTKDDGVAEDSSCVPKELELEMIALKAQGEKENPRKGLFLMIELDLLNVGYEKNIIMKLCETIK